jgi:hypothetical protein
MKRNVVPPPRQKKITTSPNTPQINSIQINPPVPITPIYNTSNNSNNTKEIPKMLKFLLKKNAQNKTDNQPDLPRAPLPTQIDHPHDHQNELDLNHDDDNNKNNKDMEPINGNYAKEFCKNKSLVSLFKFKQELKMGKPKNVDDGIKTPLKSANNDDNNTNNTNNTNNNKKNNTHRCNNGGDDDYDYEGYFDEDSNVSSDESFYSDDTDYEEKLYKLRNKQNKNLQRVKQLKKTLNLPSIVTKHDVGHPKYPLLQKSLAYQYIAQPQFRWTGRIPNRSMSPPSIRTYRPPPSYSNIAQYRLFLKKYPNLDPILPFRPSLSVLISKFSSSFCFGLFERLGLTPPTSSFPAPKGNHSQLPPSQKDLSPLQIELHKHNQLLLQQDLSSPLIDNLTPIDSNYLTLFPYLYPIIFYFITLTSLFIYCFYNFSIQNYYFYYLLFLVHYFGLAFILFILFSLHPITILLSPPLPPHHYFKPTSGKGPMKEIRDDPQSESDDGDGDDDDDDDDDGDDDESSEQDQSESGNETDCKDNPNHDLFGSDDGFEQQQ